MRANPLKNPAYCKTPAFDRFLEETFPDKKAGWEIFSQFARKFSEQCRSRNAQYPERRA